MILLDEQGRFFGKVHLVDFASAILLLFCLFGLLAFGIRFATQPILTLSHVEPPSIVAGKVKSVTIVGTGFDEQTTVRLEGFPFKTVRLLDNTRMILSIPPDSWPGIHRLVVRDGRGRLLPLEGGLEVLWQPEIDHVTLQLPAHEDATLHVFGRYFLEGGSMMLGDLSLADSRLVDSTHLERRIPSFRLHIGQYDVSVVNPDGRKATLRDAVRVDRPLDDRTQVEVLCSFSGLDRSHLRALKPGAVDLDGLGRLNARILRVVNSIRLTRQPDGNVAIVRMVLGSDLELTDGRPLYYFQKKRLQVGESVGLQFQGVDFSALILSEPIPRRGGTRRFHGRS